MKYFHIMDGPPLYTNCFLLVGDKGHAVAIDPNAKASRFLAPLGDEGAALTHILLTHGHHDHVAAVDALRKETGALVYMNEADARFFNIAADGFYVDGGSFDVDDMHFTTIFTPGHSPGSTCIRCGDLLFTGDTLFAGDIGYTHFPGGSEQEMSGSLQKLLRLVPDNPQVLPGHEEFSTMDAERAGNPYLQSK